MSVATTFDERVPELPRGVLALFAAMMRRATDAEGLTFPLRLVIVIVSAVAAIILGTTGAFWLSTAQMRSDQRDMKTMMTMQAEIDKVRQTLQDERAMRLTADMNAIKGQILTTNYDMQSLKTDVAIIKAQGVKK